MIKIVSILFLIFFVSHCGSDDYTYIEDGLTLKYYRKYRFISDRVITFTQKDEISEDDAKKLNRYYKAFYNNKIQIIRVETYEQDQLTKRQIYDPASGNLTRFETFINGELQEYLIHFYDDEEKSQLVKKEAFNRQDSLIRVEKMGFGVLEEIDYYNSDAYLTKTESYVEGKVDVVKYYDNQGNMVRETGRYDNARYPYELRYYYNEDQTLIKAEHYQKNRLSEIHYYKNDGSYLKEEKYAGAGNLIKTIFLDEDGNPIKTEK